MFAELVGFESPPAHSRNFANVGTINTHALTVVDRDAVFSIGPNDPGAARENG